MNNKKMDITAIIACICLMASIIAAIYFKLGFEGFLIIMIGLTVVINLPVSAIVHAVANRRNKGSYGAGFCMHEYELVSTKTVSYGAGFNKTVYSTYRCSKCGKTKTTER